MEFTEFRQLFQDAIARNCLPELEETAIRSFYAFTNHLLTVNEHTNLTAIRNIPDVIDKHLIDSLLAADAIPAGATVLDLGCGPGFPSIPLAIARPDLKITALDSTAKKIAFVTESATLLGLENLKTFAGRAEDRALMAELGHFDVVISRAVARLQVLDELCLPYVKIGGALLAMKGARAEEELTEALRGIKLLGGGQHRLIEQVLRLSGGDFEQRALICIEKTGRTPKEYPRAYAAILKKPL